MKSGRIVNVTSIAGKVAFPHLLPYAAAKFAATGLSEGLHSELKRDGITVTTTVPGLPRTGSSLHALFKGNKTGEFARFSIGDNLPGGSISAERAARKIVAAIGGVGQRRYQYEKRSRANCSRTRSV